MGGKSSAPPAPDYRAAAEETAAGNLAAARYATTANRPNQITPYGSSTWTQGAPTRRFNQERYDEAVKQAQQSTSGSSGAGNYLDYGGDGIHWMGPQAASPSASSFQMPDRNSDQFYDYSPSDNWTQTVSLDPRIQETLNKQLALNNRYADAATVGMDRAFDTLSDPTLDMSKIPERAINVGQTAQEAIMARLNPAFAQQEEALRTRLVNQGLSAGSEAFTNDFRNFNQKRNDAELQAALYGIGLDDQNRKSALQEQAYIQDRPLNLINALRSGAQVQNPQFSSFANQATTAGPDYMGAANAQYGAALDQSNAENASMGGLMGGLFSIGGAAMGSPWLGGLFGIPGMQR